MLNLNNVEWKKITHIHEVSNNGDIRNCNGNPLKPWISTTGYYNIKIIEKGKRKNKKLHRLVAEAFIPNPNNLPNINHLDGNKLNNCINNLEWCDHATNMKHASETKLINTKPRTTGKKLGKKSKYHNVSWDSKRNKWSAGITVNKKTYMRKRFNSEIRAALHVNFIIDALQLKDRPKNII